MFFSARVNKSGLFHTQPLTFSSRWGCVGVRNQRWWQHRALLTRTPPSVQGSQLLVQQCHSRACILATVPVKQLTTFVGVGSAVTCWYSNQSRLLHRHQTRAVRGLLLSLHRLFFVILAPQTSAAQSWQSVCPQQALPPPPHFLKRQQEAPPPSCLARVHSPCVEQAVAEVGAPPNPEPASCDTALYIWRESEWIISWLLSQGLFHLCSFTFHCTVLNQPLILTTLFSYLIHMENIYSIRAIRCFSSLTYFYIYRSIYNIL